MQGKTHGYLMTHYYQIGIVPLSPVSQVAVILQKAMKGILGYTCPKKACYPYWKTERIHPNICFISEWNIGIYSYFV